MLNIKHTEAFDLAFRFVTETNLNIFLTGKAGTGKTTFLKYLRENSFKKMVVAAPTGVAAINAGGVTLHSLFQLPFAPFIPSKQTNANAVNSHSLLSQIHYQKEKLNLLRNLELLVIDETSMVAAYTVDAIDTILKSIRRNHHQPFGGVQVLFIGDLHQLPPVVRNQEWEFLKNYYSSVFFFDSLVLKDHVPVMIELKEIFRQHDDSFIEVLNEIRNNNLTSKNFNLLNARLERKFIPQDDDGYITLTTHNNQADELNKKKLHQLSARSHFYRADVIDNFPEHMFPAELSLELKVGAQVMFLKNDVEEKKYFNGKLGVVTQLGEKSIRVLCKGDAAEIEVRRHEWQNVNYSLNQDTREISEEELGSFRQYPLRLAWAITIHKSQGLTFDKLIIDAENAFANGQVYVALSRCTSLEGLVLTSPVNQKFLGAHQNLKAWQETNQDEGKLPERFNQSRQHYAMHELKNIFSWYNMEAELHTLHELMKENKAELPAAAFPWYTNMANKQKELQTVAEKFKEQISHLNKPDQAPEENITLQQRIKDAAQYFSGEFSKWKVEFFKHPLSSDKRKVSRKLDASLEEINFILHEILNKVDHCKNGFLLQEYLKDAKKLSSSIDRIRSTYEQDQEQEVSHDVTGNSELYKLLSEMRSRIARTTHQPLFKIFSNNAMIGVCENLPAGKEELLRVKGFGKATVGKYGDEVLQIVNDYCEDHNLEPKKILKKTKSVEKKSSTVEVSTKLFKSGKNLKQIAEERNLTVGTIETHLAMAIKLGQADIEDFMTLDDAKKIAAYFPKDSESLNLTILREKIPGGISFGKLRMVQAWLQVV